MSARSTPEAAAREVAKAREGALASVRDASEWFDENGNATAAVRLWQAFHVFTALAAELERANEALRYYAEPRNYRQTGGNDGTEDHNESYCPIIQNDQWLGGQPGSRARAALAASGEEQTR